MAKVNLTFPKLDGNGPFSVGPLPSCRPSCKVEMAIFNEPSLRTTTDFRFVHTNAEGEKLYLVIPVDLLTITSENQARLIMDEINQKLSVWDDGIPHRGSAIDTLSSSEYAPRSVRSVYVNQRRAMEAEIAREMLMTTRYSTDGELLPAWWAKAPPDGYQRLTVTVSASQPSAPPQTSTAASEKPAEPPPATPALIRKVGLSKEDLRRTGARQRSAYDVFERGV